MLLGRAGELIVPSCSCTPRVPPVMIVVLLCIVVLEGEMLPEIFAAIFREFVRRVFVEGRVGKKNLVFPGVFQYLRLSPTVFATILL